MTSLTALLLQSLCFVGASMVKMQCHIVTHLLKGLNVFLQNFAGDVGTQPGSLV